MILVLKKAYFLCSYIQLCCHEVIQMFIKESVQVPLRFCF